MGKVGILVSRGYGAGWSTWNEDIDPCNKELVELFVKGATDDEKIAKAKDLYPNSYTGGLLDCSVEFIEEGAPYKISEYDGFESIEFKESDDWRVAK